MSHPIATRAAIAAGTLVDFAELDVARPTVAWHRQRIDLRPYHRRIHRARVIAAGPRVLHIRCRDWQQWCITHRSTVRPGWWQASWFDADGPFGHSEHADWAALVRHVDTSGFAPRWAEVEEVRR